MEWGREQVDTGHPTLVECCDGGRQTRRETAQIGSNECCGRLWLPGRSALYHAVVSEEVAKKIDPR